MNIKAPTFRLRCLTALILGMALSLLLGACAQENARGDKARVAHNPDALWQILEGGCIPAAQRGQHPPAPCTEVDMTRGLAAGHAVLKDTKGRYQYLVLPLARITGIESPRLLDADVPNYFADAWSARLYVDAALHRHLARDQVILAVNSQPGRSQNQLHIHLDCLRPDVHTALQRQLPTLGTRWQPLAEALPPHGHAYLARWVPGEQLGLNPFADLAAALPADDRIALHSLAMVGARNAAGEPGFVLLSSRFEPLHGDPGSSEELQDRDCVIATSSSAH